MLILAFMVIAHRGASLYAPENTLAAFDMALRLGARQIELDLQTSRDGYVVVMHDDNVDRTTDGFGPVTNLTLAELRKLDAGSWFEASFSGERIPSFEEVLQRYKGRLHIHAELKGSSPLLAQRTADLIRRHGMTEQVTVTSFQQQRLLEIRAIAPELQTGWLVEEVNDAVINEAHVLGLTQICPPASSLTPNMVRRLHTEGFAVRAWGVTNEQQMRKVVEAGADGMTVDFPDKLIAYLSGRASL